MVLNIVVCVFEDIVLFCASSNSFNLSQKAYIDWNITECLKITKVMICSCFFFFLLFPHIWIESWALPYKELIKQTTFGCPLTTDTDHWPETRKFKIYFSKISNNLLPKSLIVINTRLFKEILVPNYITKKSNFKT